MVNSHFPFNAAFLCYLKYSKRIANSLKVSKEDFIYPGTVCHLKECSVHRVKAIFLPAHLTPPTFSRTLRWKSRDWRI